MSVDRTLAEAKSRAKGGDLAGARAILRDLAERYPHNARVGKALARLEGETRPKPLKSAIASLAKLHKAGRMADVVKHGVPLLDAAPEDTLLYRLVADALVKSGRWADAAKLLRHILERTPDDVDITLSLAACLTPRGRHEEAVALLEPLAQSHPQHAKVLNNLGNALRALNRHDDARPLLERAVAADPSSADAFNNLGVVCAESGDRDAAKAAYARGLALDPAKVELHTNFAALHRFSPGDPAIAAMERLLSEPGLPAADRCGLHFALGRAYDAVREEETAFRHFERGNRLRRQQIPFSFAEMKARMEAVLTHTRALEPLATPKGPRPIFVVGLPRSGTSLVEQILSAHPLVDGLGEIDHLRAAVAGAWDMASPIEEAALKSIADFYARGIAGLSASPIVTDKSPLNFRWIGIIAAALPHASIVHVHRQPEAVCWSIYKLRFTTGGHPYGDNLSDLGAVARLQEAMMAGWDSALPGRVIRVSYETLTQDPQSEITRLLAACDLPFHEACLSPQDSGRAVMTASTAQVRRAIYGGSSEDWRRYERFLGPLKAALDTPVTLEVPGLAPLSAPSEAGRVPAP